jgi:hypothetical protein
MKKAANRACDPPQVSTRQGGNIGYSRATGLL